MSIGMNSNLSGKQKLTIRQRITIWLARKPVFPGTSEEVRVPGWAVFLLSVVTSLSLLAILMICLLFGLFWAVVSIGSWLLLCLFLIRVLPIERLPPDI